jgi:hypothetical protein
MPLPLILMRVPALAGRLPAGLHAAPGHLRNERRVARDETASSCRSRGRRPYAVARVTGQALGLGVHSASDWTMIWTSGYLHPYPEAAVVNDDIRAGLDSCRQAVQPCPDLAAGSQIAP